MNSTFLLLGVLLLALPPGHAATPPPPQSAPVASSATGAPASSPASAAASAVVTPAASAAPAAASVAAPSSSAAAAAGGAAAEKSPQAACAALEGSLADSAAGLKLEGAVVDSATLVESGANASVCKVTGSVPVATGSAGAGGGSAPARFQAHLPAQWNRHAVQFADGLDAARLPIDPQRALAAGYLVYGPGSANIGAVVAPAVADEPAIALQKRLYDVAQELMARRFGRLTHQVYLVSGAGGGIGIEMAKRFQYDFLGVLADASASDLRADALSQPAAAVSTAASAAAGAASAPASAASAARPDAAVALSGFSSSGGKLIALVPAAPSGAAAPAAAAASTAASAASTAAAATPAPAADNASAESAAPAAAAYRAVFARLGARYTNSYFRQYALPAPDARNNLPRVDWLQVLVDWSENGKEPAADLAQLPTLQQQPERR